MLQLFEILTVPMTYFIRKVNNPASVSQLLHPVPSFDSFFDTILDDWRCNSI